jgi:hypothetical protein
MPADELQPLRQAVQGLLYPSESDEPFEVLQIPAGPKAVVVSDAVRQLAGRRKVVEVTPEEFFGGLTGSDDAERFESLRKLLQKTLLNLQIFRIGDGEPRVEVYLLGKCSGGRIAGLHTISIET